MINEKKKRYCYYYYVHTFDDNSVKNNATSFALKTINGADSEVQG